MRRVIFAAAVAAALVPFSPASADHACDSTEVDPGVGVYVIVDDLENEHGSIWIYQESNGEAGLQRNDDSCNGENGDTVIF